MTKPTLLYFSPGAKKYKEMVVPNNHEPMIDRMDRWLEYYFNVVTISEDTDLAVEVRKHSPDIILFDGLLEGTANKLRIVVSSLDAYPEIPRAGLSRVDALSPTRGISFEELMMKGAEVVFTLAEPIMGESMPDHANAIIHVPWFIDPAMFKDYGIEKSVPIGMFGNFESPPYMYYWRAAIKNTLLDNFPVMYYRHPGYSIEGQKDNPFVLFGEAYAKAINACYIAPSHGGFTEIVVSKQLEIPACRTLLITQTSPSVEAHGFRHGVNCIFADPEDIYYRIKSLFNNREEMKRITDEGHRFVHNTHTYMHRPQILQWLELKKKIKPGQRIVQPTLMGDLEIVETASPKRTFHVFGSPIYKTLQETDASIQRNDFANAERLCEKLLSFCNYLSEPKLRLILLKLLSSDPHGAMTIVEKPLGMRFSMGGLFPDPIEWTALLLTLLAFDDPQTIRAYLVQFTEIHRRELDLCRWAAGVILNDTGLQKQAMVALEEGRHHFSIHSFNNFTFPNFLTCIETVLERSRLPHRAEALRQAPNRTRVEKFAVKNL